MYLHNGKIKVYEVPVSYLHSAVSDCIIIIMGSWNRQDFWYGSDATTILDQNTSRAPDHWVRPKYLPNPQIGSGLGANDKDKAYPTMMIEIGVAQSLSDLHQTAALYFNPRTTIQIVLAIKIFGVRTNA